MRLKYVFAVMIAVALALCATMVVHLMESVLNAVLLAAVAALATAWLVDRVSQTNWLVAVTVTVIAAAAFWWAGWAWAGFVAVIGLGLLAGTLGTFFAGTRNQRAPA